jgi:hypothetical protein
VFGTYYPFLPVLTRQRLAKPSCLFCRHWHLLPLPVSLRLAKDSPSRLACSAVIGTYYPFPPAFDWPKTCQTVLLVLPSLALTTPSRQPSTCQRHAKPSCLFCHHWHLLPLPASLWLAKDLPNHLALTGSSPSQPDGSGSVSFTSFNIRSGQNGGLEGALRAIDQMGVDIGFLLETQLTGGIYTCYSSGYSVLASSATSIRQGGIALFWRGNNSYKVEEMQIWGANIISLQLKMDNA